MRRRFPLLSAPKFRCCRVIPLENQDLTFDERISTRLDDFSPKSHRAVSLQVVPFFRDCKGRGYRRRARQTENEWVYSHLLHVNLIGILTEKSFFSLSAELPYDPFRSMANNWRQYCKWIYRTHRLSHSTWIRCHLIKRICTATFINSWIARMRKSEL